MKVTLLPSGHAYEVKDGQTVLAAGLAAGYAMPYSCRTGTCRTCKGRVVQGQVDFGVTLETVLPKAERDVGFALLCVAKPLEDLEVEVTELEGIENIQPKIYPCRLTKIEKPAPDVAVLTLRMPPNENMRFMAGQYIEMITKTGERRPYSLSVPPNQEGLTFAEIHVRHIPGGLFTDPLFSTAKERDLLKFEGPFGTFFIREESEKPIVMIASGTGFGPIKAMIEHALKRGSQRPISLYWGGRTKADIYHLAMAQAWAEEHPHIQFVPVLSNATDACAWSGRTGLVYEAVLADHADLSGHQVYACGAPVMVDAARRDLVAQRGLPSTEFFADSFLTAAEKAGKKEEP